MTDFTILNTLGPLNRYPKQTILFSEGDSLQYVYCLCSGYVALKSYKAEGREFILDVMKTGLLGCSFAILNEPARVTAVTVSPCLMRTIDVPSLISTIRANPQLNSTLLNMLCRELNQQSVRLAGLACLSPRERLEEFLWTMSNSDTRKTGPNRLQLPIKQEEVAHLLNISPQYLSALYRELEVLGLIKRSHGWLVIPQPELLMHREAIATLSQDQGLAST